MLTIIVKHQGLNRKKTVKKRIYYKFHRKKDFHYKIHMNKKLYNCSVQLISMA